MWRILRDRHMSGVKFRRQHPYGSYIPDFVSFDRMLVIEIDGSQHADQAAYDETRTTALHAAGFTVLRFTNLEALQETEAVAERIWLELRQKSTPSPP
ncbi:endonuclease domain-containing protein [Geomonas sp. RF6]|nr:endonuclease domain-containing protein [Geomonas sp. RF6]